MRKLFLLFVICAIFPFRFSVAQSNNKGVSFKKDWTWSGVLLEAKRENKYVFVSVGKLDSYSCELMEDSIYRIRSVGDFVNGSFVSIQIELDKSGGTEGINAKSKLLASTLIRRYSITSFPTFLFFSNDGQIVHRSAGARDDSSFIRLASHALDTRFQYYARVKRYYSNSLSYFDMPSLALVAWQNGDEKLAVGIAKCYLENYLDKIGESEFFLRADPKFLSFFLGNVLAIDDSVFGWICADDGRIDSLVDTKGFGRRIVDGLITENVVEPFVSTFRRIGRTPDWGLLNTNIDRAFGRSVAERNLLDARINWFIEHKMWMEASRNTIKKIEKYGLDTAGLGWYFTNSILYGVVFEHSKNRKDLGKAADWMGIIVRLKPEDPSLVDTYANLLYKSGKISEGLNWEEVAYKISRSSQRGNVLDNRIEITLEKMRNRQPTWPIN